MIVRIWNGRTEIENAHEYEQLLKHVVFPGIKNKNIPGYRGIQLLKSVQENAVDFVTIMRFDTLDDVKQFAGKDYEKSYVIPEAKTLLKSYDASARHFEIIEDTLEL